MKEHHDLKKDWIKVGDNQTKKRGTGKIEYSDHQKTNTKEFNYRQPLQSKYKNKNNH